MDLQKKKTFRCKKYLAFVASLPCCICHTSLTVVPHHTATGGVGMKGADDQTIPLCHYHHMFYHQYGKTTFEQSYCLTISGLVEETQREWEAIHGKLIRD